MVEIIATSITSILVALIGAGALKFRSAKSRLQRVEAELSQAKQYLKDEESALRFEHSFAASARIRDQLEVLCDETEIDRIILLVAWNGELSPQWTKAIYQLRLGEQNFVEYSHTKLDDDYRARLVEISKSRSKTYKVCEMPSESLISRIYTSEGVKATVWSHLRVKKTQSGTAYSYMSFSTHSEESVSPSTQTRIEILMDAIRSQA